MTGDGLGRGLSDMWRSVLLFIPAALAFIAILVVGYLFARLVRTLVAKGLRRAGFDRAVERGSLASALTSAGTTASGLCATITFYAVLLFALQLAFGLWAPNPVSELLTALIAWLPRAFVAIVIVVLGAAVAGTVRDLITGALNRLAYGRVLARGAYVLIISLAVIAALDQVQIATSVTQPLLIAVLATVAGVVIVGVGGGLIRPMQHRWDGWLDRASIESATIREHAKAYGDERTQLAAAHAARQAEQRRLAELSRQAEQAHAAEQARQAQEAAHQAEQARIAEQARQEKQAARRAEQAREAEQARHDQEAARQVELARQAEQARQVDEARQAEQQRLAEHSRALAQEETQAVLARVEQARLRGEVPDGDEQTQVIPTARSKARRRGDTVFDQDDESGRPHLIPGFDRDDDETAPEDERYVDHHDDNRTRVISPADIQRTQVIPPPDPGSSSAKPDTAD